MSCMRDLWKHKFMKFNPYPVLLTTGALMMATVVFAQTGPTVSLLKSKAAAAAVHLAMGWAVGSALGTVREWEPGAAVAMAAA